MQSPAIRVLLVEDDPVDMEFARRKLSEAAHARFELVCAGRLSRACSAMRGGKFDVVLLDLGLPGCDGIDAVESLRQLNRDVPIVVLTGLRDERTSLEALNRGAQDYLVKGELSSDTLVRSIRYAIQRQQLARRDEQLRRSQKLEAVGALAGGIAHEFNNLLQVIQGYATYALDGLSPGEPRQQDLLQVVKAADRATYLTRQLLGFSRQQVLERVDVDPRRLATELTKLLRPLIGDLVELELRLDADVGTLCADSGQLQQMLLNLCINARDAMPRGGRLSLAIGRVDLERRFCEAHALARPGPYMWFSVADTGCGMSPAVKERVFEPFFTTKDVGRGTGLGLAVVYGIVEQHGGAIDIESDVGRGTTFNVYLPISSGPRTPAARASAPARGGEETVLVAEDEQVVRDLTVRILSRAGYRLLVAADGAQALELFRAHADSISLVLLDAIMPRLTGREVYQHIQQAKPGLPVVFASGYDPETGQVRRLGEEGVKILHKPFDADALLRAVREGLDHAPMRQELTCLPA
ncbi:MAG TPA: response regulator [Pirellulales bacterium]|nr:response regulator [Pirellulales bacterium]